MKALVIEDELRLARNIARMLDEQTSFAVDISTDGREGRHMAMSCAFDLVILDLMLPGVDGMTVLRDLRGRGITTPVLILTARDTREDIVRGLDVGGDDYLAKPFDMDELLARCRALVRRSYGKARPIIAVGEIEIDTTARKVVFQGRQEDLPAMEYRLIEYLAMRLGDVVSKEEILDRLYGSDTEPFSNVIEVYVSSLRKRFGVESIHTVRGLGYRLQEGA